MCRKGRKGPSRGLICCGGTGHAIAWPGGGVAWCMQWTGVGGCAETHMAAAYAWARMRYGAAAGGLGGTPRRCAAVLGGLGGGRAKRSASMKAPGTPRRRAGRCRAGWRPTGTAALLVFDDAADPADLLPFLRATGAARVLVFTGEPGRRWRPRAPGWRWTCSPGRRRCRSSARRTARRTLEQPGCWRPGAGAGSHWRSRRQQR